MFSHGCLIIRREGSPSCCPGTGNAIASWRPHEGSRRPRLDHSRLAEGARRGPPEDVGGPWGYGEFLEAIADPKHERHKELIEWRSDFHPQQFDIDKINRRLAELAPHKITRRKTKKQAAG